MKNRKILALLVTITLIFTVLAQPLFTYGNGSGKGGNSGKSSTENYGRGGSGNTDNGKGGLGKGGSGKGASNQGELGEGGPGKGESNEVEPGNGDSEKAESNRGETGEGRPTEGESGKGGTDGSGSSGKGGTGGSGSSSKGEPGGGKPDINKGSVAVYVTVEWPIGVEHPAEVYVTLYNSDSSTTVLTVNGMATFYSAPGDDWMIKGEVIPDFDIPEKAVQQTTGRDESVHETLTYKIGGANAERIELNKTNIMLYTESLVQLTARVYPGNAKQKVTWTSSDTQIVTVNEYGLVEGISEGEAFITATSMDGITAICAVEVKSKEGNVPVTGITVDENHITLILRTAGQNEVQLNATIAPENATVKDVMWKSSNENVVTVNEYGKVSAVSAGSTVITVTTIDGEFEAYTRISVVEPPEIEYIYPTLKNEDRTEHFDNPFEIYLNVVNLVNKLIEDGTMTDDGVLYYVRVMEKGSNKEPLGVGQIILKSDTREFNIFDLTNFTETKNFSNRYFVDMSQFSNFPKSDEQTLSVNFMGRPATPTIPKEDVVVNLKVYGGGSPEGIIFLLAREEIAEGQTIADVTWRDYYINGRENSPVNSLDVGVNDFIDEVKMVGVTNAQGVVEWIEPREKLKLGGYLLLQVTPPGYEDNLSDPDPSSDDGNLLKQVGLKRGGSVHKEVVNTYVGL